MIIALVISNILYLLAALVVAVIGALIIVVRHRKPKSVEANVASFNRGLRALAPDRVSDDRPTWGGARPPARPTVAVPEAASAPEDAQARDATTGVEPAVNDPATEPVQLAPSVPTEEADTG